MNIKELFGYYGHKSPLLKHLTLDFNYSANPKDLIFGRQTESTGQGEEVANNLAVSKLVDYIERYLLERLNAAGKVNRDEINNAQGHVVGIYKTSLNSYAVPYGAAKDIKLIDIISSSELVLIPDNLGTITFYAGESIDGEPGIWYRRGDGTIQVGIAFKLTKLNGYQTIV